MIAPEMPKAITLNDDPCADKSAAQICRGLKMDIRIIDPSAGSPTETLLRLLLPLSNKVHSTFHS